MINETDFVWSTDEETYNIDSLGDLIRDYDIEAGTTVYYGKAAKPSASSFIDTDDIIEDAQNRASDNYGEFAECFLDDITDEAKKELNDFLSAWMEKYGVVTFYMVEEPKEYVVTEQDVIDANS